MALLAELAAMRGSRPIGDDGNEGVPGGADEDSSDGAEGNCGGVGEEGVEGGAGTGSVHGQGDPDVPISSTEPSSDSVVSVDDEDAS